MPLYVAKSYIPYFLLKPLSGLNWYLLTLMNHNHNPIKFGKKRPFFYKSGTIKQKKLWWLWMRVKTGKKGKCPISRLRRVQINPGNGTDLKLWKKTKMVMSLNPYIVKWVKRLYANEHKPNSAILRRSAWGLKREHFCGSSTHR